MTEVPDHLLQRSRERRAALGLGGGDDGGAAPAAAAATPATTSGAPAPAKAAKAAPVVSAPKPPPFIPPYVKASERRTRVPMWVLPVVAFLPVWGILYAQSLSAPPSKTLTELQAGAGIFTTSQCAGCHGGSGGGGVGPAFTNGEVIKTFPNIANQIEWVALGSNNFPGSTYGAPQKPKKGGMPTFRSTLTDKQLLEVIRHERETLGGEKDIKVDATGARLWPGGKPMLDSTGILVWPDGEAMLDDKGNLTKKVDPSQPAQAE